MYQPHSYSYCLVLLMWLRINVIFENFSIRLIQKRLLIQKFPLPMASVSKNLAHSVHYYQLPLAHLGAKPMFNPPNPFAEFSAAIIHFG